MIRIAIPSLTPPAFLYGPYFRMYPNEGGHLIQVLKVHRSQTGELSNFPIGVSNGFLASYQQYIYMYLKMLTVCTVASLVMVKVTRSVGIHLALKWVHSSETFLRDVVEVVWISTQKFLLSPGVVEKNSSTFLLRLLRGGRTLQYTASDDPWLSPHFSDIIYKNFSCSLSKNIGAIRTCDDRFP